MKYPIGIQTFKKIRKDNFIYVDKTELIYKLAHESQYLFLSRPRRFGKSLLLSTLESYFKGEKELFKGLAIEKLETEWTQRPVLHFDMSTAKHKSVSELGEELGIKLSEYEKLYGKEEEEKLPNQRLAGLIKRAYQQTGQQVVVLIDEYDAPLLDVVYNQEVFEELRYTIRNFYSPLKACDPYLHFVFLTGITKFSQLSIFSELNNIRNVSMLPKYAAICGITEDELKTVFAEDIEEMAANLSISTESVFKELKHNYDGYHFSEISPDIYNPFSLLNAFADRKVDAYWFASGTPTYLIEMLNKFNVSPEEIDNQEATADYFDAPMHTMTSIMPLLYQSGYITIKTYNPITKLYTLAIPNNEVRIGLMKNLLNNYVKQPQIASTTVAKLYTKLLKDDLDEFFNLLKTFLGTVPYTENTQYEGHYQSLFYVIFSLLGQYVDIEIRTPQGRVDMVLRTATRLYLIEFKIDASAEKALQQIDLKQYPERFALAGLPITKVGVNFSSKTKNIESWEIK